VAIHDPTSTLVFYRRVLRLRAQLPTTERLTWAQTSNDSVHFARERLALGDGLGPVPIAPRSQCRHHQRAAQPGWASPTHHRMDRARSTFPARGQLSFITA
jgi:hypothetical protein